MNDLTPEYRAFLDRRYSDLKQIVEAVLAFWPPEALEENHLMTTIECEMDWLADKLGYEDVLAMLERLTGDVDEDDEEGE